MAPFIAMQGLHAVTCFPEFSRSKVLSYLIRRPADRCAAHKLADPDLAKCLHASCCPSSGRRGHGLECDAPALARTVPPTPAWFAPAFARHSMHDGSPARTLDRVSHPLSPVATSGEEVNECPPKHVVALLGQLQTGRLRVSWARLPTLSLRR